MTTERMLTKKMIFKNTIITIYGIVFSYVCMYAFFEFDMIKIIPWIFFGSITGFVGICCADVILQYILKKLRDTT